MPVLALFVARPLALPPFQSPVATPAAAPVAATAASSPLATPGPTGGGARLPSAAAAIPPILWILAGLLLGSAIVLIVRRAAPHDG